MHPRPMLHAACFETAISATRSPLSLEVVATNWQKSVASVVKVFSRTAGAA